MNEYAELRQRQQAEFNVLPLGFAFSRKQFDEMMEGWPYQRQAVSSLVQPGAAGGGPDGAGGAGRGAPRER